jgi:hypothetical protein
MVYRKLLFLVFLGVVAGNPPLRVLFSQEIRSGSDPQFKLTQLKTFNFMVQQRKSPDGLAANPGVEQLIRENLEAQLVAAGYMKTETTPDFLIAFYGKSVQKSSWQTPGYKVMRHDQNIVAEGDQEGTLVVDFISRELNQGVWRGVATKALTMDKEKDTKMVRTACQKLIKQYQKDVSKQTIKSAK